MKRWLVYLDQRIDALFRFLYKYEGWIWLALFLFVMALILTP